MHTPTLRRPLPSLTGNFLPTRYAAFPQLDQYAAHEADGGEPYVFGDGSGVGHLVAGAPGTLDARAALKRFEQTGAPPHVFWTVQHYVRDGEAAGSGAGTCEMAPAMM